MTSPPRHPARRRRVGVPVIFYAHPFELGLGAAFVILGLKGLLAGSTSPSVDALPAWTLLLYRVATLLAGVAIIAGLLLREHPAGRAVERFGCYVLASVLLAFALILIGVNGWAGFATGLVCALLGLACLCRARAVAKTERVILEQLRAANAVAVPDLLKIIDGRPPRHRDEAP